MPLSWNEIKDRALRFSKEWEDEKRERAEKDTFWNEFFNVFGISRRRVASFEEKVKKLNDNYGFIDLFWEGKLLVEHKSRGEDLGKAYSQAGTNHLYWKQLSNKSRTAKMRFRKQFERIVSDNDLDTIKQSIKQKLIEKAKQLLCYDITD